MKNKILLAIIIGTFLIGIASACQVSLSPSQVNITTYPGETHAVNLSITSDGYCVVSFNTTLNGITISPPQIATNGTTENLTIYITFPYNMTAGNVNFNTDAFVSDVQAVNNVTTTQSSSSPVNGFGSQGGYIYVQNSTNLTIYVPVPSNETTTPPKIIEKFPLWLIIFSIFMSVVAILLLILLIIKIEEKRKRNEKR